MTELPAGTVTFLFTDVEGSTRLWEQHQEAMRRALARHDALVAGTVADHGGAVVHERGEGDSFFAVFADPAAAVAAAGALQRALLAEPWPPETPIRVRMALHTGSAHLRQQRYYGVEVNRCARVRGLAHGGQILLTEVTAHLVRGGLPPGMELRSLGSHRLKDLSAPEPIYQLVHPALPDDFPPLRSLSVLPNNLPTQLSSFVGREQEIQRVEELLRSSRLVTLIGAGGCGKTRLALQVAADLLESCPDGVWMVDLGALREPELVAQAVAQVCGVEEQAGRSLAGALADHLRERHALLLLDNCEHLVAACAALAEGLLRGCPELRILATSREPLAIPGEVLFRVPSLSLPEDGRAGPAQLLASEAVRLFVERAAAAQHGFTLTEQNGPAVLAICRQLDGIPLALELAAARVKVLTVEQISARLDDRFRLLTAGSRTALPRQQTLRAMVDWSHELLSDPERVLFRRLAVFAGGCSLEMAEAVCAGDGLEAWEVLDLLSQLVDKSLLVAEEVAGEARYRLLETMRQYGGERLRAAGEEEPLRRRHLEWCLELVERQVAGLSPRAMAQRLDADHDNLRAALLWCQAAGDGPHLVRLVEAVTPYWLERNFLSEGRRWLEQALESVAGGDAAARARLLGRLGAVAARQGDYAGARAHYEACLAIHREAGDLRQVLRLLPVLGYVARNQQDFAREQEWLQEALAMAREMGDNRAMAALLKSYGDHYGVQGKLDEGVRRFQESLPFYRAAGDEIGHAYALTSMAWFTCLQGDYDRAAAYLAETGKLDSAPSNMRGTRLMALGWVACCQGDLDRAERLAEEALAVLGEEQRSPQVGNVLRLLAFVKWRRDDHRAALEALRRLKEMGRRSGNRRYLLEAVEGLALVAAGTGRARTGALLLAAAQAAVSVSRAPWPPNVNQCFAEARERLQGALGDAEYAAAWAEGEKLSLEEALNLAEPEIALA